MKTVRKVTVKSVVGNLKKLIKAGDISGNQAIMRIMGSVSSLRSVQTTYGDSTGFKGQFEATNLLTGELFSGMEAFLPGIIEDKLVAEFQGREDQEAPLVFACDVFVQVSEGDDDGDYAGYEYSAAPLTEARAADPFAALRGDLPPLPALPNQADAFEEPTAEPKPKAKAKSK